MSIIPAFVAAAACVVTSTVSVLSKTSDTESLIAELAQEVRDNYVFPELGQKTADYLLKRSDDGAYDGLNKQQLEIQVTQDLREITHDLHFGLRALPDGWAPRSGSDGSELADPRRNTSPNGFMRVERLDGNIGYLELQGFMEVESARDNANAAMQLLAGSSALIIDLRQNGGGHPGTVQLLSSYLFDPSEPVHLNSLYYRPSDETTEYWTHDNIKVENAMPDVPVYVLTSGRTFSAAEEFTYNLQCLDRATIVGETTGGGAHPVDGFIIADQFVANIPIGRAINPITKTNWEGVGVIPDIAVSAPQALDAAIGQVLQTLADQGDAGAKWGLVAHNAYHNPLVLSKTELSQYPGQYTDRELMLENGELMYRRIGNPNWSRLIAAEKDIFVIDGFDGFQMHFERDSTGSIEQIVGHYEQGRVDYSVRQ